MPTSPSTSARAQAAADPTESNLALVDELIEGWVQLHALQQDSWTFGQRGERPHVARFASIYALAAHAHSLIEHARGHLTPEGIPFAILQVR